jgi:hypothetical protein
MKKLLSSVFFVFCLSLLATVAFAAQPGVFTVDDGEWKMRVDGKLLEAPTPNGGEETDAGWIYWLFDDPSTLDEVKGGARGVHFYSETTKKYSFMPVVEKINLNGVHFSPDGKMFVLESTRDSAPDNVSLELYDFASLAPKFKTGTAALPPQWIDAGRFVYSRFEPGTSRGKPADYYDEWKSLAMYDTVSGEETVLKEATKTSDFSLMGLGGGEAKMVIVVWEEYVASPKDWADPEKQEVRELIVPVPPAG